MCNSNTVMAETSSGRAFNFSLSVWGVHPVDVAATSSPKLDALFQCPKLSRMHLGLCFLFSQLCY